MVQVGSRSTRFGALFGSSFDLFIGGRPPHPLPMSIYHFNVPKAGLPVNEGSIQRLRALFASPTASY
jgi:hypothetical protein